MEVWFQRAAQRAILRFLNRCNSNSSSSYPYWITIPPNPLYFKTLGNLSKFYPLASVNIHKILTGCSHSKGPVLTKRKNSFRSRTGLLDFHCGSESYYQNYMQPPQAGPMWRPFQLNVASNNDPHCLPFVALSNIRSVGSLYSIQKSSTRPLKIRRHHNGQGGDCHHPCLIHKKIYIALNSNRFVQRVDQILAA